MTKVSEMPLVARMEFQSFKYAVLEYAEAWNDYKKAGDKFALLVEEFGDSEDFESVQLLRIARLVLEQKHTRYDDCGSKLCSKVMAGLVDYDSDTDLYILDETNNSVPQSKMPCLKCDNLDNDSNGLVCRVLGDIPFNHSNSYKGHCNCFEPKSET